MPQGFDPGNLPLPFKLQPRTFEAASELLQRWAAGLGRPALSKLDRLPPFPFTGCTIQLMAENFTIAGGVYWREQVTYHRPVTIGETLTTSGRVETTYMHDGRLYAVMSSQTAGSHGRPVATSRSTGLQQYRRNEEVVNPSGLTAPPPGAPAPDPGAARSNPALEDLRRLSAGDRFQAGPVTVTLKMMQALAGGDESNPIHTDEEVARKAGLRAPIAGGPHVLAFAELALIDAFGAEVLSHGSHVDVRWISPLYADGTVSAIATVTDVESGSLTFELSAEADGVPAMVGTAFIPVAEKA